MSEASRETIAFVLNGDPVRIEVATDEPLSHTLRQLGETTVRESCAVGLCGCCTAMVDGVAVSSCLYWSILADGTHVTTLDGLRSDERITVLQESIADHGAAQCGYCTPGMILTALDLFEEGQPDTDQISAHMNGNLCRCACYPEMKCAIKDALRQMQKQVGT